MKRKFSITLDPYTVRLLERTARIYCLNMHEPSRRERQIVLRWAIRAFCFAAVKRGKLSPPPACDLREETKLRLAEQMPNDSVAAQLNRLRQPPPGSPPPQWN